MPETLLDPPPRPAPQPASPSSPTLQDAAAVPDQFRDPDSGALRVDALVESYLEMERRLGGMVAVPAADAAPEDLQRFRQAIGVPATPEEYRPVMNSEMLQPDPDLHKRLHEAGFTADQVQLVYDLAADHVVPLLQDMGSQFEAERERERLSRHFGGEERWRETARQLATWGRGSLPPPVFEALAATSQGVLAMHAMMQSGEPAVAAGGDPEAPVSAAALDGLIGDPRYWRDRDPALVARVTEGFKRLYAG